MFFRVLMIGALAAAGAGADGMTLHWGDPALAEEEPQGLLYWTNTTTPPTLPLTDAELTPDDGPNAGQNLLRKNADKTWEVSVNLPGNPENGGTGFIVLSWNGQTPIVVRQNADWSLQATYPAAIGGEGGENGLASAQHVVQVEQLSVSRHRFPGTHQQRQCAFGHGMAQRVGVAPRVAGRVGGAEQQRLPFDTVARTV
jgi:hypothetical protein